MSLLRTFYQYKPPLKTNIIPGMVDVIYIAGNGRSGSTILGDTIGSIGGMYHVGELKDLWGISYPRNYNCGCGNEMRTCGFWNELMSYYNQDVDNLTGNLSRHIDNIPRSHYIPYLMHTGYHTDEYLENYLTRLYESLSEISESDIIVDSSKLPSYLYVLSRLEEINLKVIHLVRDPRAVCYSWNRNKIHGFHPGSDAYIGAGWITRNFVLNYWGYKNPSKYLRIYYENFALQPRNTLNKIIDEYGIKSENPVSKDGTVLLEDMHTTGGNPSKFKRGEVEIYLDDEWKNNLNTLSRRKIEFITLPLIIKYSYIL